MNAEQTAQYRALYLERFYEEVEPDYLTELEGDEKEWAEASYADRMDLIGRHHELPRKRLLEMGAGRGDFACFAQRCGWNVVAVEPAPLAQEVLRRKGVPVVPKFAEDIDFEEQFEAVVAYDLLEHVGEPGEVVRKAHKALVPGGLLLAGVPNEYSFLQDTAVEQFGCPEWWKADVHLHYFDFGLLEDLLCCELINPIERSTTFPMELFILMGVNYVNEPEKGPECHKVRKAMEKAMGHERRREFYRRLASVGIGRHAIVLGRKV